MDETSKSSPDPESRPGSAHAGGVALCEEPTEPAADQRKQLSERILTGLRVLDDSMGDLTERVDAIGDFAHRAKELLVSGAERQREDARTPLIESLFRLHDFVHAQVRALETGDGGADPFCASMLASLEGELERNGIEVLRPELGGSPQWGLMHAVGKRKKPFWRRPDTIAFVHRCGFAERQGERRVVLRKADIEIYT